MILLFLIVVILVVLIVFIGISCKKSNFENIENYHFLHISKNGGTSIKSVDNKKYGISNHDYTANDINDKTFFAVIRDPIDRFISAFNFAKRGGFTPEQHSFMNHPIHYYQTINHFLDELRDENKLAQQTLWTIEAGNPADSASVVYWPQVHWLRSNVNKRLILFDFDNIDEHFEKEFGIKLPEYNKTRKKVSTDISPKNIEFLRKLYAPDFKLQELVKEKGILTTDTNFINSLGTPDKLVTPKKFLWNIK